MLSSSQWAADWVANITGSKNSTSNNEAIVAALARYFQIHGEIFGEYSGRLPPRPLSEEGMAEVTGTMIDFIAKHDLEVLHPFFYQFFVMQGMGLLETMPAYYCLAWANPTSIRGGGFGNDADTPLAILKDGYGALVSSLAADSGAKIVLGAPVRSIRRQTAGRPAILELAASADISDAAPEQFECDIVVSKRKSCASGPSTLCV